jgi:hypothetical protein
MDKKELKKKYQKPEVRRVKLSLAELTLGSNCDIGPDSLVVGNCAPGGTVCNL